MKRAIAILLVLMITVQAQTYVPTSVTIGFTPGLEYTDGVPLTETEIEHYDLYCDGAFLREVPNDFTRAFTLSVDDIGAGSHTCTLSETVAGIESVASDPTSFPLGQRTPGPPTDLTVVPGA